MVAREGFEPSKAHGRQIYSLLRLTASLPRHLIFGGGDPCTPPSSFGPPALRGWLPSLRILRGGGLCTPSSSLPRFLSNPAPPRLPADLVLARNILNLQDFRAHQVELTKGFEPPTF